MTLTELRYIIALAKEKHFGKAANACFVSQPTLSVAINKLESKLGIQIFERLTNEVKITPVGELVVSQAKKVIEETLKIKEIAKSGKSHCDSPLKIGAIYTVAPYLFPKLIPILNRLCPSMPLIIHEDFTGNLRTKLQEGLLDIIFVALPFAEPCIVTRKLYQESLLVLMKNDHALAMKKSISNNDLVNEKILLLEERHCLRDCVIEACPNCYKNNENTMYGASLETLRHMVASGNGITVLPSSAAQIQHYQSILCTRPLETKTQRTIALAWRKSFTRTKAIDAIISAINECQLDTL